MCIVSFVLSGKELIVTFNRDEDASRAFAEPSWDKNSFFFSPIDKVAGGTWIGINSQSIMCLQNGGRENHQRRAPYEQSRGVLLMELLKGRHLYEVLESLTHIKTEPFTLSLLERQASDLKIYTYDGEKLTSEYVDLLKPVINCSSTLYDQESKTIIESDFNQIELYDADRLLQFHEAYGIGRIKNNFVKKKVMTTSIIQFVLENGSNRCRFINLLSGETKNYDL